MALACTVASAGVTAPSRARAAPLSAELVVERAPGAGDCPDLAGLSRIIEQIVGPATPGPLVRPGGDVRARAYFARSTDKYQATLSLGGKRQGERTLTDTGPTCTALGRAVGITIALTLDIGIDRPSERSPVTAIAVRPPSPATASGVSAPQAAGASAGTLGVTLGPALGFVGSPSLAMGVVLAVELPRRAAFELDGQYVAPRSTSFEAGAVDVALLAARLRACGLVGEAFRVRFHICAAAAGGQLRGHGRRYALANGAATLPWIAAGGGLGGTREVGRHWRMGVSADALAPLRKSTFSIVNRGVAYRSSAISLMLQVSVGLALW
jgi:hypothetical protein